MKTRNLILTGFLGVLIFLSSCARIYINEISKSQPVNTGNVKNVVVVGLEGLSLNEFVKTFHKKYKEDQDFIFDYANLFTSKLQNEKIFTYARADKSAQWNLLSSYAVDQKRSGIIDSLFTNCGADYLICLSDFEISNRYQTTMTGGGANMPMTSSSTEYCVIKSRFKIFDTKTRQKMMEFTATGEGQVIFFTFEAALINAMNKSIDHAVAYIKTGKIKF